MAAVTVDRSEIKQLDQFGVQINHYEAGEDMNAGDVVYMAADEEVMLADRDDNTKAHAIGIVMTAASNTGNVRGETDYKSGQTVAVLQIGRVSGFTFANNSGGKRIYVGEVAGALDDATTTASGETAFSIGYVLPDNILFVNPPPITVAVNT